MHYNFEEDEISKENIDDTDKHKSMRRNVLEYVVTFAVIAVIIYLLQAFVIINARIPSASMENTIMTGERLFGNRLAYTFGEPERYDIVIFKYPDDESQLFIKRVIGLPGETIIITDGEVYAVGCYTDTSVVSDETGGQAYYAPGQENGGQKWTTVGAWRKRRASAGKTREHN